jgi:hypothetical protein
MGDSDEQYNFSANMVTNKYSAVRNPTKNAGRKIPRGKNMEI